MSTPATLQRRDEALARNAKKREQQNRQHQQPSSSNYVNYRGPNTSRTQQIPAYRCRPPSSPDFSEDVSAESFDWDDWQSSRPIPPPQPPNIVYKDMIIKKDNVFIFHGKDNFMSTFYEAPFKLRNFSYPNVETYYEACKLFCLVHFSSSTLVQKAKHAAEAKRIAGNMMRKHNISRKVINQWKLLEGAQAVFNATLAKFEQNPELKKKLLDTGDKFIVQCYEKDNIFGSGCAMKELEEWFAKNEGKVIKIPVGTQIESGKTTRIGKGSNLLGYFCMSIREEFHRREPNLDAFNSLSLN